MPVQFTTTLPNPSSASASLVDDSENISLSWTRNDTTSVGGHDIERADNGGSFTTIASGLSETTTSYTDTNVVDASSYEYRVQRYTDDTSSYSNETSPLRVPKRLTRNATVVAGTTVTTTRSATKTRTTAVSADTQLTVTRTGKRMPRSITTTVDTTVAAKRQPFTKQRTIATTVGAEIHDRAEFREVFPDEQTEDLSWDFSFADPFGFVSEWFDESADLSIDPDAFAVVVDSYVVHSYEIGVEYDVDGDGVAEYRTDTQTVERDGQTLTFPNLGEPGQYRLYIQQMRPADYLRAVTVGPTRY